jgi:ribosomal protein L7/L12
MAVPWLVATGVAMLVLPALAMTARRGRGDLLRPPKAAVTAETLPAETRQKVAALIAGRRKIEAIKLVRETVPMGLREAKDLVDLLERRGGTGG